MAMRWARALLRILVPSICSICACPCLWHEWSNLFWLKYYVRLIIFLLSIFFFWVIVIVIGHLTRCLPEKTHRKLVGNWLGWVCPMKKIRFIWHMAQISLVAIRGLPLRVPHTYRPLIHSFIHNVPGPAASPWNGIYFNTRMHLPLANWICH